MHTNSCLARVEHDEVQRRARPPGRSAKRLRAMAWTMGAAFSDSPRTLCRGFHFLNSQHRAKSSAIADACRGFCAPTRYARSPHVCGHDHAAQVDCSLRRPSRANDAARDTVFSIRRRQPRILASQAAHCPPAYPDFAAARLPGAFAAISLNQVLAQHRQVAAPAFFDVIVSGNIPTPAVWTAGP